MSTHVTPQSSPTSALNLEIKSKLDALQEALLSSHPTLPTLLRDIHRTLKAQPDQVTLMTPEEIQIVVLGLAKQTTSHLVEGSMKPTKAAKESLKKVKEDDLF